jgi:S1-C subfamily serine protease
MLSSRWFQGLLAVVILGSFLAWQAPRWVGQPALDEAAAQPRPVVARGDLAADEKATIELFQRSKGSVVYISTTARVLDLFSRNIFTIPQGTGSGFVWDELGHIVTNNHVITNAAGARVRLNDGRDYNATLVGASPVHDLAVLRIAVPHHRPPPLPIGTSADLKVGQKTFAIGNPFGLDWSLTTGIVSALDRALPGEDGKGALEHMIQTDAAINPGNSGGPLLDSSGRLIGINSAIFSPSGAYAGIGFAVPVDTVNRVVPQLIAKGKYIRPVLGIVIDEQLNELVTRQAGLKGVVILKVSPGSPAAAAGLRDARVGPDGSIVPGDIITAVDGKPVDGVSRLLSRLDEHQVGDTVKLTVRRNGKDVEIPVTLSAGA